MLSLLLISENAEKKTEYITSFLKENNIAVLDVITVTPETSLGVEDIRNLQKQAHLAPIKGDLKIIVLEHMELATIEAQNALLKMLEEPPLKTQIILTATTLQYFLPTVVSRCKIISLEDKKETLSKEDEKRYQEEFENIISADIAQRLKIAQDTSIDKQHLQQWLRTMIISLRSQMLNSDKFGLANSIYQLQEALNNLQTTNSNPRMLLEHALLNLPFNPNSMKK